MSLDWDTVQESEADSFAFKTVLNRNYDVREVRTLYANLQNAVRQDQRVGLGFLGSRRRTVERMANVEELIGTTFKSEIDAKGKLTVTDPEFVRVMATLKRDNGIMACTTTCSSSRRSTSNTPGSIVQTIPLLITITARS